MDNDNFEIMLKSNVHGTIKASLLKKDDESSDSDYISPLRNKWVYNDNFYTIYIKCSKNVMIIDNLYINDEPVRSKFEETADENCFEYNCGTAFRECFGVVKIELDIDGITYVTENIPIMVHNEAINQAVINMIDYIYANCENYLYEEHKYSKSIAGIKNSPEISIDSRLSMLKEILDTYKKCYAFFCSLSHTKLVNSEITGDFEKLHSITSNTVTYIITHPEELRPVNYNSGISYNGQYYEPDKTLITSTTYSQDIYENRVVIGFIKKIISELNLMLSDIKRHIDDLPQANTENGYVESTYYIYTRSQKALYDYRNKVQKLRGEFESLYHNYKRILVVSDFVITVRPRFTNVFKMIIQYRLIYKQIIKWFECGNYDFAKTDLILNFITLSKIYEYYCLLKLNINLKKTFGFVRTSSFPNKYEGISQKYYRNTKYNNTFLYKKDDASLILYYQPIIYGRIMSEKRNNIMLYRNTTISISKKSEIYNRDNDIDIQERKGNFYTPDFIIRIDKGGKSKYYIFDAKFSSLGDVKKYQLPSLIYKYFFSISPLNKLDSIDGLCFICGKMNNNNDYVNVYDIATSLSQEMSQFVYLISLSGNDFYNDNSIIKLLGKCIS